MPRILLAGISILATRQDLFLRSNAQRLAQLSVPTDRQMMPDFAFRDAIVGNDISVYSAYDQESLVMSMGVIDSALIDAEATVFSYGVAQTAKSSLLTRITTTIALHMLGDDTVIKDFEWAQKMLEGHSKGMLSLVKPEISPLPVVGDVAIIASNSPRYGRDTPFNDWI